MIKKLTKREQKIFVVCVAVLCVYVGFSIFFEPLMAKLTAVDEEIRIYEGRLNKNIRTVEKAKGSQRQYDEYLSRFKQSKTDEQVMTSILSEIERVSGKFGLPISELKPKRVMRDEHFNKFSVSLMINGELIDILRFLHTLQDRPHFFNLEEARFDTVTRRTSTTIKTHLVLSKILIP